MKVNIMSDPAIQYLMSNLDEVKDAMVSNRDKFTFFEDTNYSDIHQIYSPTGYDIDLDKINLSIDDVNGVILTPESAIRIYEEINKLPQAIITHRGFWLWLMFECYYPVCSQMLYNSVKEKVEVLTIKDYWLLKSDNYHHRNLMFGILSRNYFAVNMTIDVNSKDPYYITKWALQKLERFRNFTFRTFSNSEKVNKCGFKAILKLKDYYESLGKNIEVTSDMNGNNFYPLVTKELYAMGSIKLLDFIDDEIFVNELVEKVIKKIG